MIRLILTSLATLLAAAVLVPAAAARAPCPAIPADPADWVPIARSSRDVDGVNRIRSTLAVCERGGRRVVLRRARLLDPLHGRNRGVRIGGAAAAGRRVAWIEARFAGRRRTVVLFLVRVGRRGSIVTLRRQIVSRDHVAGLPDIDVAITARGELAWLRPRSRDPEQRNDIVYDPPDGRPRRVGTDDAITLAIEDGHTLRWNNEFDFGFFEMPRPGLSGCRHRTRHRVLASNREVLVRLRAYYGDEDDGIRVIRACRRADGRETVVSQTMSFPDGDSAYLAGLAGPWLVLVTYTFSRYDGCAGSFVVQAVSGATGRRGPEAELPRCGPDPSHPRPEPVPGARAAVAVTGAGKTAWVYGDEEADRVLATGPGRRAVELDAGPPGTIAGLRAEGDGFAWTREGQPRSSPAP